MSPLEILRSLNLGVVCALAIACQLLAIIYFVERLKAVDGGLGGNVKHRELIARQERQIRAGYGLCIDLSLYLLAVEIVLAFLVLGR